MGSCIRDKFLRFLYESTAASVFMEVMVRLLLFIMFAIAEFMVAVQHTIQPEDMWKYRYPYKASQVPFGSLLIMILVASIIVFTFFGRGKIFKGFRESSQATLGLTYSMLITGMITNVVKTLVGRPRPNYLVRCYGSQDYLQVKDASQPCIESNDWVGDLRKSFPSGHSSIAFSAFLYLTLYIAGKLGTFNNRGRANTWKLLLSILPVSVATWVAITRFTDYHHHYDDILIGSILGSVIAYISYRQYYPSLDKEYSQYPVIWLDLGVLTEESQQKQNRNRRIGNNTLGAYGYFERNTDDRVNSEPLFGSISSNQAPGSRGTNNIPPLNINNSELSISVHVKRRPRMPSSIMNNPELSDLSKASTAFYWDEEDLDHNGVPLLSPETVEALRQELLTALANLDAQSSQTNLISGCSTE